MTAPFFTVIMATWGRGRHILPSITSVLQQHFPDFELLVVGDACTDETEAVVRSVDDPRLCWINLETRVGSQSGPNNAGIAAARGGIIAYLGHDDLWEPDHLKRLLAVYQSGEPPDFVMSGSVLHPPYGLPGVEVMGIFPDGTDTRNYFFPPSAFSHLRSVVDRIGPWRMPSEIRTQVDDDFLRRAADAGLRFRSTRVVTMHKFPAALRYLSYLCHSSDEQEAVLDRMGAPDHAAWVAGKVAEAKAAGRYMMTAVKAYDTRAPGELARISAERKGAKLALAGPIGRGVTVRHRAGPGALDWNARPILGFRINRASPSPCLLVPVTGGRARLRFLAAHHRPEALGPLALLCNGVPVTAYPGRVRFNIARYTAQIDLRPEGPTLLQLLLSETQRPRPGNKIAIGALHLVPL